MGSRKLLLEIKKHKYLLFFITWSFYLSIFYLIFGPFSYIRIHDNGDGNINNIIWFASSLKDLSLTNWNPLQATGVDTNLSTPFIGMLPYLPFFTFLPNWLAYGLFTWLQRFIAGYFTFRLLKDSLKLDSKTSVYGGIYYSLFAQSSMNSSWQGFTLYDSLGIPSIPLILWFFSEINLQKRII